MCYSWSCQSVHLPDPSRQTMLWMPLDFWRDGSCLKYPYTKLELYINRTFDFPEYTWYMEQALYNVTQPTIYTVVRSYSLSCYGLSLGFHFFIFFIFHSSFFGIHFYHPPGNTLIDSHIPNRKQEMGVMTSCSYGSVEYTVHDHYFSISSQ